MDVDASNPTGHSRVVGGLRCPADLHKTTRSDKNHVWIRFGGIRTFRPRHAIKPACDERVWPCPARPRSQGGLAWRLPVALSWISEGKQGPKAWRAVGATGQTNATCTTCVIEVRAPIWPPTPSLSLSLSTPHHERRTSCGTSVPVLLQGSWKAITSAQKRARGRHAPCHAQLRSWPRWQRRLSEAKPSHTA